MFGVKLIILGLVFSLLISHYQKQPPRGVPRQNCSENMQQNYRRTPMPKCLSNFIKITLRHRCSPVNLQHIFRTPFLKNSSKWLLLHYPDRLKEQVFLYLLILNKKLFILPLILNKDLFHLPALELALS